MRLNPFQEFIFNGSLLSFRFFILVVLTYFNFNLGFSLNLWSMWILSFVWVSLIFLNINGLIFYRWTWRMYPLFSFYIALRVWGVFCLRGLFYMSKSWTYRRRGHYIPLRSPSWLWLFLPLIEIISQIIRPLTLTLRLRANLVAGHSILFLIGCLPWMYLSVTGFLVFVPFELIVAVVQSVVFSLLLQTYSLER